MNSESIFFLFIFEPKFRNERDFENLDPEKKALIDVGPDGEYHTNIDAYLASKIDFMTRISSGEWESFEDYLKFYNNMDVNILDEGIANYIEIFKSEFNVSPLSSMSMPSMASRLAFSMYDPNLTSIFTFSSKWGWLNADFRSKGLNGGLTGK